jgi:hypothetical protein
MIDVKTVNSIIFYLGLSGACTDVRDLHNHRKLLLCFA